MTPEQKAEFFSSETFKKTAKQAYYYIDEAKKAY